MTEYPTTKEQIISALMRSATTDLGADIWARRFEEWLSAHDDEVRADALLASDALTHHDEVVRETEQRIYREVNLHPIATARIQREVIDWFNRRLPVMTHSDIRAAREHFGLSKEAGR